MAEEIAKHVPTVAGETTAIRYEKIVDVVSSEKAPTRREAAKIV
jgi:hypothetical protein